MPISNFLRKASLYFIVTFSLFSGSYILGGLKIYPPALFAILGFALCAIRCRIPQVISTQIYFGIVLLAMTFLSFLISQNSEFLFVIIRYLIKAIFIPVGCCLLIRELAIAQAKGNQEKYRETIISATVFALVFQLLITAAQLSLPEFRATFNSVIDLTSEWKVLSEDGHFRATGLAGLSIYDTSICYGLLFLFFSGWCFSSQYKYKIKYVIISLITVILALIAGRSGFILFFIIFCFNFIHSKSKIFYTAVFVSILFLTIISVAAVLGADNFNNFLRFVFEPVYNFIDTGSLRTESTNELLDSYLFIPWEIPVFTGDGFWAQPDISNAFHYIYKTDSGIILNYIAFGIWGLIFTAAFVFNFMYNYIKYLTFKPGVAKLLLSVSFIILILSFLLKGPIFFSERIMMAFYLWLVFNSRLNKVDM